MEKTDGFPPSPRDTTPIIVEGEEIDTEKLLSPIPAPRITSREVPRKLPSLQRNEVPSLRRRNISPIVQTRAPSQKVSSAQTRAPPREVSPQIRVSSLPSRVNSSPRRIVRVVSSPSRVKGAGVFSPVPSPGRILTPLPSYEEIEERRIHVIKAAPKGFLNMPIIPDYSLLTPVQQEALRAKYNMKLDIIRKTHPHLPGFTTDESLEIIHVKYEQYVRQAYVDKAVAKYKIYMTIVFLIIEALGTRVFGIPISGYTRDQLSQFVCYEQLLMELAERSRGGGEDWPVEIRIFFFMAVQAVIFVIIKFLSGLLPPGSVNDIRKHINDTVLGTGNSRPAVDEHGIPEPPKEGFDPTNIISTITSFLGGGSSKRPEKPPGDLASHRVPHDS